MGSFHAYTGLSGEGTEPFSSVTEFPTGVIIDVTDLGGAQSLDPGVVPRYLHIGWFALADDYVSEGTVPDGEYLHEPIWIWYPKMWIERQVKLDSSTGTSGFRYALGLGVVADFYWYY